MKPFVDEKAYHVGSSVQTARSIIQTISPRLDLNWTFPRTRSVAAARARGLRSDCPGRRRVLARAFAERGRRSRRTAICRCSLPNSELSRCAQRAAPPPAERTLTYILQAYTCVCR